MPGPTTIDSIKQRVTMTNTLLARSEIDQLGLCASHGLPTNEVPLWKGAAPEYLRVAWMV